MRLNADGLKSVEFLFGLTNKIDETGKFVWTCRILLREYSAPFTVAFSGGGVFTATSGSIPFRQGGSNTSILINVITGTLTGFAGFDPTPGIATFTFTQSGSAGQAISGSGTISAEPVVATPVPATLLMAGFGGVMLAGVRRLRNRVS